MAAVGSRPKRAARELRVELAEVRGAPELLEGRRLPIRDVVVHPARRVAHRGGAGPEAVDQLREREGEIAAHVRVGARRAGEHEGELALERTAAEMHALVERGGRVRREGRGRERAEQGRRAREALGVLARLLGDDGEAQRRRGQRRRLGRGERAPALDGGDQRGDVHGGEEPQLRRGRQKDRICRRGRGRLDVGGAVARDRRDPHTRAARARGGEPRHGAYGRRERAPRARLDRGGDVQQPRGGVRVPEARREPLGVGRERQIQRGLGPVEEIVGEQREHRIAVAHGVRVALAHEQHGGVARLAVARWQHLAGGALGHRLAREVDRAHDRGVDLASAERPRADGERGEPGALLGRDGVARPAHVELVAQSIRDDVGHAADDGGPGEAVLRERGRERVDPTSHAAPAHGVPRDLRVGLHANEDGGTLLRQPREGVGHGRALGHREQPGLLWERRAQVVGGKAQPARVELDGRGARRGAARRGGGEEPLAKLFGRRARAHGARDDRDLDVRARARAARGRAGQPLLEEEVGVVAAEAEVADRRAARRACGRPPGLLLAEQAERAIGELVERGVRVARGRANLLAHRGEHLDDGRRPRSRDEVPDVRLERADRHSSRALEHRAHAADLRAVAHAGPGGVTLDERDVAGREAALCVRGAEGADLAFLGGDHEAAAPAVVREAHAPNDAEDAAPVGDRVVEALEEEKGGPLRGHEAVGLTMKRSALSCRAQRAQRREAAVKEQIVCVVHAPGEREIGAPVMEREARELQRVERRRTRGVQGEGFAPEAHRRGGELRGQPRHEAVSRIGAAPLARPDLEREVDQARAWGSSGFRAPARRAGGARGERGPRSGAPRARRGSSTRTRGRALAGSPRRPRSPRGRTPRRSRSRGLRRRSRSRAPAADGSRPRRGPRGQPRQALSPSGPHARGPRGPRA